MEGPIQEGRLASVQMNHDPGWRAEQDGRPIQVERDLLGYLVLRANASPMAHIHLKYRGRPEQYIMAALIAIVWIGSLLILVKNG